MSRESTEINFENGLSKVRFDNSLFQRQKQQFIETSDDALPLFLYSQNNFMLSGRFPKPVKLTLIVSPCSPSKFLESEFKVNGIGILKLFLYLINLSPASSRFVKKTDKVINEKIMHNKK